MPSTVKCCIFGVQSAAVPGRPGPRLGYICLLGAWICSAGIASLAVAVGLRSKRTAAARVTSALFAITALLSLAGAVGFVTRSSLLEMGVLISGVTFVFAALAAAWLLRGSIKRSPIRADLDALVAASDELRS